MTTPSIRSLNRCALALLLASGLLSAATAGDKAAPPKVTVSVFVNSGLVNPRGLHFGPDGALYVAEGGSGGTTSTTPARCQQVPAPVGPYKGSPTGGRISRIDRDGHRTTVTDTLPSSQTSDALGALISGVADVAFVDGKLYALLAAAGCSHGVPQTPNGVVRVHDDGTWELVANLSAYQQAHPVKNPEPDDFEPDGTWWGMVVRHGDLFAVEPNHGELVRISLPDGAVTRVADISATQGHVVPTAVAWHDGAFYVANLGRFDPDQIDKQSVYRITQGGQIKVIATGLSKVLGLTFDERGRIYVLETSYSSGPGPVPFTGRLLRILRNGEQQVLIDSTSNLLFFPTGLTFGRDGALYIANFGFGPPPAAQAGQILRVRIDDDDGDDD